MVSYRLLDVGADLEGSHQPLVIENNFDPGPKIGVRIYLFRQFSSVEGSFYHQGQNIDNWTEVLLGFSNTLSQTSDFIQGKIAHDEASPYFYSFYSFYSF